MTEVAKALGMSLSHLNYYTKPLMAKCIIYKIGKSAWKVNMNIVQKLPMVANHLPAHRTVRGHAFVIQLIIPKFDRWDRRVEYLKSKGIDFEQFTGYQRILINGMKVWLCDNHKIIFYLNLKSFYGKDSRESYQEMCYYLMNLIRKTEALLNVRLNKGKGYDFRVARNHYSLINNMLAKQYLDNKSKLFIFSHHDGVLRLLVDDSNPDGVGLNELETVHPRTAKHDNPFVQQFYNALMDGEYHRFIEITASNLKSLMDESLIKTELIRRLQEQIGLLISEIERMKGNK